MTGKPFLRQFTTIILTLVVAVPLFTACTKEDEDVTPPTITVTKSEVDISGGKQLRIDASQLFIGEDLIATWSDDRTKVCTATVTAYDKAVQSGTMLTNTGILKLTVADEAGNTQKAFVKLKVRPEYGQPTLTVVTAEVNVFGGSEVKVEGDKLLIDDDEVASWTPNDVPVKTVTLTFKGADIASGATLSEAGLLVITVTSEVGKTASAVITITNEAIYGIETLKNATMKVDEEINLLNGITFAEGVELVKVEIEIDGKRSVISDPSHYTPEYPGTCSIILTVKGKNGESSEIKVDKTIKPLEYKEATINTANMISEKYPWYNNLQKSTKDFIYPHLIASYAACNRSKQDNRVHIIMGETADTDDIENIGQFTNPSDHAYEGYYRIRALSPDASIKCCKDYRINLENYINQHPDKFFLISCASDALGGRNREELINDSDITPFRRILEKENVIVIDANGNGGNEYTWKGYNENIKDGTRYNSGAINSKLNNKITVVGYNSWGKDNYFSPDYSKYGGLKSSMPVGFDKNQGNIVMPMIPLISSNNKESVNTNSSFPTAVTSGVIGNAISIIMANHPGITAEDAMTIIANNYLIEKKFQYMDETTNWNLTDGGEWYFLNMQSLLDNELLQRQKIDAIQFNHDEMELPSGNGLCYVGKGIQLEYDGQRYDITSDNNAVIQEALKSDNVRWYWNKDRFKKFGGTTTAAFDVLIVDKNGKEIPGLSLEVNKAVQQ